MSSYIYLQKVTGRQEISSEGGSEDDKGPDHNLASVLERRQMKEMGKRTVKS